MNALSLVVVAVLCLTQPQVIVACLFVLALNAGCIYLTELL